MGYWVRLTEDGTPDNYSGSWFDGAEWIEKVSSAELDTCRWTGTEWVEREQTKPYEPTPEEVAAATAAVDAEQAEAAARAAEEREMEIVRLSGPDQLLRSMGKITIAELTARVAVIRAKVEAGG